MIFKRKLSIAFIFFLCIFSFLDAQNKDNYFEKFFHIPDGILADTLPLAPVLRSPANNALTRADTLPFKWNSAKPNVTQYHFQLSADSNFNDSFDDSTILGTFTQVTNLLGSKQYWWRVQAYNSVGWGPYSLPWTFTTKAYNYVNENDQNPLNCVLSPNPANDYMNLSVQSNDNLIISPRLRIINSYGYEYPVNYIQKSLNPSNYILDIRFLPNGSYLLIFEIGNSLYSKPFIVFH